MPNSNLSPDKRRPHRMDQTSAKKKRTVWSEVYMNTLLELWAERAHDFRRAKRNGHIFKDISAQMGGKFTPDEIQVKIRNFTQKYREEKKVMGPSGGSPSTWTYFGAVHKIIGSNAANCAPILESALFENSTNSTSQSSELEPSLSRSSTSPVPPPDNTSSTSLAASSSGRKRNHLGEVVQLLKEQNGTLRTVVEDNKALTTQMLKSLSDIDENGKEFLQIMRSMLEKI